MAPGWGASSVPRGGGRPSPLPRLLPMRSPMSWARCPQTPLTPTRKESCGSRRLDRAASRAQCPEPLMASVRAFLVWKAYWMPCLISSMIWGRGARGSGAAPLPAPARTPLRGARPSGAYLEHLLVHVPYHLLPARRQDARGQVGGAGPQQEPPGDGQGLAQGRWGGHQQLVGGHGPHPTCRLVPQGGAGRAQGPEHLPAGRARLAWGGQARGWPGGEAWHRASAAAAAFRCALLSPVQLSMLVQHVRAWQRGC